MIDFKKTDKKTVSEETLNAIYEKIKTPYKKGAVLKFDNEMCDSPVVFFYNGKWYMSFIKIAKDVHNSGYDSHLAVSDDLINWEYVSNNMKRSLDGGWDSNQIAGYPVFIENDFYGNYNIQKVKGNYYFAYLGGALKGYETDPLSVGMWKCTDILDEKTYVKLPEPVLSPFDADAREGEKLSLFKSDMFVDGDKTLGYRFVNAYNARGESRRESVFLAVSDDGEKWERYGKTPVLSPEKDEEKDQRILGDAQILKMDGVYVMVYFVCEVRKEGVAAFNTFACSYDLINWTKWKGKHLIESEYEWENKYAHKPWIVVKDDVVYHFYNAVNTDGERFIALATSKPPENL